MLTRRTKPELLNRLTNPTHLKQYYGVFLPAHEIRLKENDARKIETKKRLQELQPMWDKAMENKLRLKAEKEAVAVGSAALNPTPKQQSNLVAAALVTRHSSGVTRDAASKKPEGGGG